jgi:hypothetical protein
VEVEYHRMSAVVDGVGLPIRRQSGNKRKYLLPATEDGSILMALQCPVDAYDPMLPHLRWSKIGVHGC